MFRDIGDLEDKSAAGIVRAADAGELPTGNVRYSEIIREARDLVADGRGHVLYAGAFGRTPNWVEPTEGNEEPGSGGPSDS